MKEYIVAIDGGLNGGIAVLSMVHCAPVALMPMPARCGEIDVELLTRLINLFRSPESLIHVYIEALPEHSQSKQAMRSMAYNYGRVTGAIEAKLSIEPIPIPAGNSKQSWQRMLGKVEQGKTKERALEVAREIWPDCDWPTLRKTGKKIHDGVVDAALIGEFARRKLTTQTQNI